MAYEYEHERRVEFAETDMAGIVHFANFFRYMEAAEHTFVRSLGLEVHGQRDGAMYGWARVHAECRYMRPLRYPQRFSVRLLVTSVGASSLGYKFVFRCEGETVAIGALKVVCVTRGEEDELMRSRPMPPELSAALEPAPSEILNSIEG